MLHASWGSPSPRHSGRQPAAHWTVQLAYTVVVVLGLFTSTHTRAPSRQTLQGLDWGCG